MKKLIVGLFASVLLLSSCVVVSVHSSHKSMRGYSTCAANDPIEFFIKQDTAKRKIKLK